MAGLPIPYSGFGTTLESSDDHMMSRLVSGAIVGFIVGLSVLLMANRTGSSSGSSEAIVDGGRHSIQNALRAANPGDELHEWVIIYIGSSTCNLSNHPELPTELARIRSTLDVEVSRNENAYVTLIGVDINPAAGKELEHLRWAGSFDQVSLGGSFLNWLAGHVSWSPFQGAPGVPTPQIVVVRRSLKRLNERATGMEVEIMDERIVGRRYGFSSLQSWDMASLRQ